MDTQERDDTAPIKAEEENIQDSVEQPRDSATVVTEAVEEDSKGTAGNEIDTSKPNPAEDTNEEPEGQVSPHQGEREAEDKQEYTPAQPIVPVKNQHKHNLNVIVAVIITVMIALSLIGLVYVAYTTSNKPQKQTVTSSQKLQELEDKSIQQTASSEDIDQSLRDMNAMMTELEQQESLEVDISDETLGL